MRTMKMKMNNPMQWWLPFAIYTTPVPSCIFALSPNSYLHPCASPRPTMFVTHARSYNIHSRQHDFISLPSAKLACD